MHADDLRRLKEIFFCQFDWLATNLLLFKIEYRGDTLLFAHATAWVAAFAYFLVSSSWYTALATSALMLAVHTTVMVGITLLYRLSPLHPLWAYPGPIMHKLTSLTLLQMVASGKRFDVIKRLHNEYGTFVRTGKPQYPFYKVPRRVQPIYTTAQSMDKSEAYRQGRAPDGGLFFIRSREQHNLRRKVVEKRTRQMLDTMEKRKSDTGVIDMTDREMTFGSSSRIEMMEEGDPNNMVEIFGEVPALFDILWNLPAAKDLRMLEKFSTEFVATRKEKYQGDDIASHLLGEHGGTPLTDKELVLDSTLAISAGSDTTAGTLTFMLFHLLSNRDAYAKLLEELEAEFYSASDISDYKALMQMPYLSGVVYEALRLGTPFGGMPRVVPEGGAVICEKYVPAGTIVGVPLSAMQTSAEHYFPAPEEFHPERWQPNGLGPQTRLLP
ncbi:cytochrome P450 [Mucidula mucida]|nr:cytochrome P450 [Mucidula mucida]